MSGADKLGCLLIAGMTVLTSCTAQAVAPAGPEIAGTVDKPQSRAMAVRYEPQDMREEPELVSAGVFTVYAYCPCSRCCGQWAGGPTASGAMPEEGRTVAADWDVLPAGTELYIDGVGWYTVEDSGTGVTGNTLDLYMDSHEAALEWGVKELEVLIQP